MHALLSGGSGRQKPLVQPTELYPRRGQEAIYSENWIIERVRIEGVDCTGWGVTVTL